MDILIKSNRINEFVLNPEVYLKNGATIIRRAKKTFRVNGIKYYKTDEYYTMDKVFDDIELFGYEDKNILEIDISKKKMYTIMFF